LLELSFFAATTLQVFYKNTHELTMVITDGTPHPLRGILAMFDDFSRRTSGLNKCDEVFFICSGKRKTTTPTRSLKCWSCSLWTTNPLSRTASHYQSSSYPLYTFTDWTFLYM